MPISPRTPSASGLLSALMLALGLAACGADAPADDDDAWADFVPPEAGIRRLLAHQYTSSIRYLLGEHAAAVADPLPDIPIQDFVAIGAAHIAIGADGAEHYEASAFAVAGAAVQDKAHLAGHVPCVGATPSSGCYRTVAEELGYLAWRRPLEADEVDQLASIGEQARDWAEGDFDTGLRYLLSAMFSSPHFLYVVELGEPDPASGAYRLTPFELATRMSLFLQGRTPGRDLLQSAADGALDEPARVLAVARGMVGNADSRQAVDHFFDELLHLRDLPGVNKDEALFPHWTPAVAAALREETLRLIRDLAWEQDTDFLRFLDADYTFVNRELAAYYGLSADTSGGWQAVDLNRSEGRAGYLGQGGFLARFAHPADTSPTRRGHFVQQKLRCKTIPPPPPDAVTTLPEVDPDAPMTKQELVELHMGDPACRSCHIQMDPVGLALERFGPDGLYRTHDEWGFPIETEQSLTGLGTFSSAAELGGLMADDPHVANCLVTNLLRGSLGILTPEDHAPALRALEARFEDSGFRLQELMVQITVSPAFRLVGEPR